MIDRNTFLLRERVAPGATIDPDGQLRILGVAYAVLPCRCGHRHCPGWARVLDLPAAKEHHQRAFGGGAT